MRTSSKILQREKSYEFWWISLFFFTRISLQYSMRCPSRLISNNSETVHSTDIQVEKFHFNLWRRLTWSISITPCTVRQKRSEPERWSPRYPVGYRSSKVTGLRRKRWYCWEVCDSDLCRLLTTGYSGWRSPQLMLTRTDSIPGTEILHSPNSGVHCSEEWGIQNRESKVIEQEKTVHFLASDFRAWEFPGDASGKESTCPHRRCKRHGSILGLGRSSGEGQGNPFQYFCLQKSHRVTWWAIMHRIAESDMTETTHHACTICGKWPWLYCFLILCL